MATERIKVNIGETIIMIRQYKTDELTKGVPYEVIDVGISHVDVRGNNRKVMAISHGHYYVKEDAQWRQ